MGDDIAAVLVEPIVGNFGIVEPKSGFLEQVNELTHNAGALVIYDEVITAFRFMYGGAQDLLGVKPDLTALGKIIGGGLPIGAYGGKKRLWNKSHRSDLLIKRARWRGIRLRSSQVSPVLKC